MFIPAPPDSPDTERLYRTSRESQGFVMNLTRAWGWRPDVFDGFAALRAQLTSAATLSKREQAVIVAATAGTLGDSYCALAWGKTLAQEAGADAAADVIAGASNPDLGARGQALAAWTRKVVADPNATTRDDVAALRDAGFTDREIVEATMFIAFRLAFSTVNDALGVQPDAALAASVPAAVRAAIDFGRPVDAPRD